MKLLKLFGMVTIYVYNGKSDVCIKKFNKNWGKSFSNCTIEDVVTSFNEQLVPQIQKLYEPGGRRYLESKEKIDKMS